MFSFRRKHSMKKWKSDTPHKLQEGGIIPQTPAVPGTPPVGDAGAPTADPNAAGVGAGNAAISAIGDTKEPTGTSPMEGAIGMAKGMGVKKKGGIAPGKFLRQGGATGRKLL
tara:strand:- start:1983 stop:2318 length:336 start_codon:yes stop_codon:yes gene_type:complete